MTFKHHFCVIFFLVATFFVGTYLFSSGFLLTRHEVVEKSKCKTKDNQPLETKYQQNEICWNLHNISQTYKRVLIIIIDALRYDFIENVPESRIPLFYQNKLTIFNDLVKKKGCSSVRIFRFIADAPTTTMQRIKGMTTGSFPTFFDVSSNFDSSEIFEDNLIHQIVQFTNITFLGDDTWVKLFPNTFKTEYPFPSFDVKDLDSVDDGILNHFDSAFNKTDWKLLIAHFLGVDHCGHRYGPFHSEMSRKLKQMNKSIKNIVENMKDDDLLLVMGDHGMTHTGDHGGDTHDEINSALIAYNPAGNFVNNVDNQNCLSKTVQQIDLVPTISLIFGTPIPFGNLGMLISDFLPTDSVLDLHKALTVNAAQVYNFLTSYQHKFSFFSENDFQKVQYLYNAISSTSNKTKEIENLKHFLVSSREMCRAVWAQFNMVNMVGGLFLCFFTILWMFFKEEAHHLEFTFFLFLCSLFTLFFSSYILYLLYFIIVCAWAAKALFFNQAIKKIKISFGILFLFYPVIYLSNSFILNEDLISLYLFSSLTCLLCYQHLRFCSSQIVRTKKLHCENSTKLCIQTVSITILMLTIYRCAFYFRKCRPEQDWCYNLENIITESSATDVNLNQVFATPIFRFLLSSGSLLIILTLQTWNEYLSNQDVQSLIIKQMMLWVSCFCVICYWWSKIFGTETPHYLYLIVFPRCCFVFTFISILSLLTFSSQRLNFEKEKLIVLSNSILNLCTAILLLVSILLGSYYAQVLLLYVISTLVLLKIINIFQLDVLEATVLWSLSSAFWWFATGHQNTFSNIPWESAFVGFQGNHETVVVPAILVTINIFSSQILHTVLLPLVVLWPYRKQKKNLKYSSELWSTISDIYLKYISVQGVKLIGTMLACCIHKRHLMVWAIFAPRFMFEGISFVVVCVTSFLMLAFIGRLNYVLSLKK